MELTIFFSALVIASVLVYTTEAILVALGEIKQNKNRERALKSITYFMIVVFLIYTIKLVVWHM